MTAQAPAFIAGVGASAGALEPLMTLTRRLPSASPGAFVVAQHTAPTHESLLAALIARRCALDVVELDAKPQRPRAGCVYVTPAGADAVFEQGVLQLARASAAPGSPKPSIDRLFFSMAAEIGPRAVAVVLSGTGSDGARGARAVRQAGGLTIAQAPETAKFVAMPQAALRLGCIDLILTPSEIAALFAGTAEAAFDTASLREARRAHDRQLARVNEELHTAYEELGRADRARQSGGEALRIANQELQTANEELQASIEELSTVNEELELRSQQLAEMAAHLDAVLRRIASPVLVVDARLRLSGASAAARALFGFSEAAITARAELTEIGARPSFPALAPLFREAMARNAEISREIDCPDAAWSMIVAPFHDADGGLGGAVAVFADHTERRAREARLRDAMEKLAASNAELERFSYVASHDLKEPVRTLAGFAECLGDPELSLAPAERAELLGRIRENARRLGDIIDSLLAFSRIDREVHVESVDLGEAAREATGFLARVIAEAGAQVEIGPLPQLRASRVHMRQLFQNLIGNAVKFRGQAPCRITLSAERAGGAQLITVADNGRGVPEAARAVIFEVFRRLDPRGDVEGAGLGLSICRKIVEQYGGRIWCEAAPGGGAVFRITFPVE